jgi:hypothetical protein
MHTELKFLVEARAEGLTCASNFKSTSDAVVEMETMLEKIGVREAKISWEVKLATVNGKPKG